MARILVGTRKGLFIFEPHAGSFVVSKVEFLGAPVSMLLSDPTDGTWYVALNHGHFGTKLHRSDDQGTTWQECQVPVFPEGALVDRHPFADPNDPSAGPKPASLEEIWSLESAGPDHPGMLWAGTIPGGLFRSPDRGASWQLIESLWDRPERSHWFGGGKDHPGIHSICVDPRDSRRVAVGISCGGVWETQDGGQSWNCRAEGMRAEYMPPDRAFDPNIQDPHRVVRCAAEPDTLWAQHHNGVFVSRDNCGSWQEIENVPPSVFGFAVAVHPQHSDTAWFVPAVKDECRVPVDGQVVVTRTRDGGQTFELLREGLPQQSAYDIVFRHALEVDSSGERLVMGSSTGGLWFSPNGGDHWTLINGHLPQIYCLRWID